MFSDQALGLKVDGLIALSPDMGYNLPFNGESYNVEEPIVEDNVVKGVFGKNEKGEEEKNQGEDHDRCIEDRIPAQKEASHRISRFNLLSLTRRGKIASAIEVS